MIQETKPNTVLKLIKNKKRANSWWPKIKEFIASWNKNGILYIFIKRISLFLRKKKRKERKKNRKCALSKGTS